MSETARAVPKFPAPTMAIRGLPAMPGSITEHRSPDCWVGFFSEKALFLLRFTKTGVHSVATRLDPRGGAFVSHPSGSTCKSPYRPSTDATVEHEPASTRT